MKAYLIVTTKPFNYMNQCGTPQDLRPTLIIADGLSEAAKACPGAFEIKELDCKDIIVLRGKNES